MDCVSNIKSHNKLRESLIELKNQLKENKDVLNDIELKKVLIELINHEDAKVRKNVAFILGFYHDCLDFLFDAYDHEQTEYVKEAYLKGISQYDLHGYINHLKAIQKTLMSNEDVETKHVQAQLKILNPLILKYQQHKKKMIKLKHEPVDVILTTLPYYQFVAFEHVLHLKYKPVSQGVLVRTDSLYDLQTIRVYKDMLLPIGASLLDININAIEEGLKRSHIIDILDRLYDEPSVFYYRVVDALRVKNPNLVKQVSQKIFELYPQRLLNSSEKYDIQIILKEVKKDTVSLYLQLSDNPRFLYRKNTMATSMQPYVAATLVELAKPYMKDQGKVIDPFVGTGTLLIEKNMVKPSHFAMGVDIYNDGIEMARKNTKLAGQTIYYVHKDSLRFSNNEMFDEIITDMPTLAQMKDEEQLRETYDRSWKRFVSGGESPGSRYKKRQTAPSFSSTQK